MPDLNDLQAGLADLRPALKRIGVYLLSRAQRAFRDQARGPHTWPARLVPNVPGIVRDLEQSPNIAPRRFEPRPAGIDTGQLRASLTYQLRGANRVVVGSTATHAERVQRGGRSPIPVSGQVKTNLRIWYRANEATAKQHGFMYLLNVDQISVNQQRRPFLLITPEDREVMGDILGRHIAQLAREERGRG